MKTLSCALRTVAFAAVCLAAPSLSHAQATRTWVSGVGDDVNPCSRTAPCKTFAGAISKTATGGEINVLDPGGFGAVTITKSITIDGSASAGSILSAATNAIVINITAAEDVKKTVRIRGLSLNGVGTGLDGIKVVAANKVLIEDTAIDGFNNGIVVAAPANAQVFVKDSTISNNSGNGILVGAGKLAMSGVALVFNGTGAVANGTGTITSFKDSAVHGNQADGARLPGSERQ